LKRLLLFIIPVILFISSCNWFKTPPDVGVVLAERFNNKLFKDFDTATYNVVFNRHFDSLKLKFSNPKVMESYYADNDRKASLVTRFYSNGQLDSLKAYIGRSDADGFNPEIFGFTALGDLLTKLTDNKFKNIAEVYPVVAELELRSASSLLKYDTFIRYGSLNPKKLINRYFVTTLRPDKEAMDKVLNSKDLLTLLKDMQPSDQNYKVLKNTLASLKKNPVKNAVAIKVISVNMERSRWKIPGITEEYVEVNIPDFSLTWFNKQDTVTHMKVCVGGRREKAFEEKLKIYQKSHNIDDKPKNHQTPIMLSKFNAIQANPVWNIPVSIAQSEIYYQALRDPYYLSNNNMKVYYKGKQVMDPDTIQWNRYSRDRLPFQFKQGSGAGNALGKFKFIFDNDASIYLHDTNNKAAFSRPVRAISHGCVRVEKPLEFAEKLVNNKYEYDQLRMEVNLPPIDTTKMAVYRKKLAKKADTVNIFQLKPKWFGTRKNISVFLNYKTAWAQNGKVEYRNDVYDLDDTIFEAMKKFR